MDSHKDQAGQISSKQTEIADNWEKLKNKVSCVLGRKCQAYTIDNQAKIEKNMEK